VQSWEADESVGVMVTVGTSFFLLDVEAGLHLNFNPNKVETKEDGEGDTVEIGCVVEAWRRDKGDWQEMSAVKA
jgi:hypothetical protein